MFSWQRFIHVFLNDFLAQYKKVLLVSGGALAIGLFVCYVSVPAGMDSEQPRLFQVLFPICLLFGGAAFTSIIYSDMHHPLERYHCLMLPLSALERFISRYLLTGPLYLLYVIVFYWLFEQVAALLTETAFDNRAASFSLYAPFMKDYIKAFFAGHAVMLLGAIYFRGYALPKTLITALLLQTSFALVLIVSVKLMFWEYFESFWSMENIKPFDVNLELIITVPFLGDVLVAAFYLWILFIGYTCLREHEV